MRLVTAASVMKARAGDPEIGEAPVAGCGPPTWNALLP
jgi:hypothetical protein